MGLAEFHSSRNLVLLAVMCVSQSRFFPSQERLEVAIFLYLYISLMTSWNVSESERLELAFKPLWNLGLVIEEVKMSRARKEKR